MSSLYELTDNYKHVESMLLDEDIDEQMILDTLESIEGEIEDKADNYAKIIKELESQRDIRKSEAKRLQESATVYDNRITRLKNNLLEAMKKTNKPKFSTAFFNFNIAKNGGKQPLKITGDVPKEYTKIVLENDTEKIRQALEAGKELDFAFLAERGESLRIK